MRVLRVALAGLYAQPFGQQSVRASRHTQVISCLRRRLDDLENSSWLEVTDALEKEGLTAESVLLGDLNRIRYAEQILDNEKILTSLCDAYPTELTQRLQHRTPPVLWVSDPCLVKSPVWRLPADAKGKSKPRTMIAGVGCRQPLTVGVAVAKNAGWWSAQNQFLSVSGGAIGCDAAFADAVFANSGTMLHILPTGIDNAIWPYIGYAISAYPPGTSFNAAQAMERNQIIYALANVSLVCSVRFRTGGSWHGATTAIKNHQPVAVADWTAFTKTHTHTNQEGTFGVAQRALCSQGAYRFTIDLNNIRGNLETELNEMLKWGNEIRKGEIKQGLFAS
jgi:predicted Rossmann fold nucleotide-binding protein DprA/Smf involved in DNA uptake